MRRFTTDGVVLAQGGEEKFLAADAAYILIGYRPDAAFQARCGVELAAETGIPSFDEESCESNVFGLYLAGTLQAGRFTNRIFIENSRDHGPKIVRHLLRTLRP